MNADNVSAELIELERRRCQALIRRGPVPRGLIHHSDRGVQYLSIRYTERLAEAGVAVVVQPGGSVRDADVVAAADEQGKADSMHACAAWTNPKP